MRITRDGFNQQRHGFRYWRLAAAVALTIVLGSVGVWAEDDDIAELRVKLETAEGAQRVDLLNRLAKANWGVSSDAVFVHAAEARELAERIDDQAGEAEALRNLAIGHWYRDDHQAALELCIEANGIYERLDDRAGKAASLSTIGTIYLNIKDFDTALTSYNEALELAEGIDDWNRIGILLTNLGTTHLGLEKPEQALTYFQRAQPIIAEHGSRLSVLTNLANIGGVHRRLGAHEQAIQINEQILPIAEEIGSKVRMADSLGDLGLNNMRLGRFREARTYLHRALAVAQAEDLKRPLISALEHLVELEQMAGDYQVALTHQKRAAEVNEELYNEERARAIADLQVELDTAQKEREIAAQRAEIARINLIRWALAVIVALVLILTGLTHARFRERQRTAKMFEEIARTDSLTGLENRRSITEALVDQQTVFRRHEREFAVVLVDIDHFKKFNDRYGHATGDAVLVAVSEALGASIREVDSVGRWGGEEFLILVRDGDLGTGVAVARRAQEAIRATTVAHDGVDLNVTASLGVSVYRAGLTLDECIGHADSALYKAKDSGRDTVVPFDEG